ncbi:MAG: SAM-dependent methyltransferase [Kiritimatiellae bacterium]|nr:SAM-dependent methyltransferase [Kiritimatiellia bacterium]
MERFELEKELQEEIRRTVFGGTFIKIVQSVRRGGKTFRISMRPVTIGAESKFQAEMVDGGQVQVRNFDAAGAARGLEEIINQRGARELHLIATTGDLHVRVTKKGKVLVSRSAPMQREAPAQTHDRVKDLPLNRFESAAFLRVAGLTDGSGEIRASMRGKYDQVNKFLGEVCGIVSGGSDCTRQPLTVVDCGCGKAYLTLAMYGFLTGAMGFENVRVTGVDRREDVILAAREMAKRLDWQDRVEFVQKDIADFDIEKRPGENVMVTSLHACDTATDEALAKAVEWKAKWVLSAPCCQHELQKSLTGANANAVFAGLLRQAILRERLCDILTDTFRALIMRMAGYRTQVVEFVAPERTARNILLKCEAGLKPAQAQTVSEYLDLRNFWKVVPWLEERLATRIRPMLERFE